MEQFTIVAVIATALAFLIHIELKSVDWADSLPEWVDALDTICLAATLGAWFVPVQAISVCTLLVQAVVVLKYAHHFVNYSQTKPTLSANVLFKV